MDFTKLLSSAREDAALAKDEKLFNLLMNFRLGRTPKRKIVFVDFRSSAEYHHRHISEFANVADVEAADHLLTSLAGDAGKFTVFAVSGSAQAIPDLFRSRVDIISVYAEVNLDSFLHKFPFLGESAEASDSERRMAAGAFPTFAADELLYCGVFSFNNLAIAGLRISVLIDMTPNGLSEASTAIKRCAEISTAAVAISDALKQGQRVLVVDAKDGNLAGLAATAGLAVRLGLDATTATSRVMAKTDLGVSPSAEDVHKISRALTALKQSTIDTPEPGEQFPIPARAIPGILTRISLPEPRAGKKFPVNSIDALQEVIATKRKSLTLEERDEALDKLNGFLMAGDLGRDREALRQTTALLAFIADEWPEEVELSDEATGQIKNISSFCFEHEPTEFHGQVQYSEVDGFPVSLTDCVRALVLALQIVI